MVIASPTRLIRRQHQQYADRPAPSPSATQATKGATHEIRNDERRDERIIDSHATILFSVAQRGRCLPMLAMA